MKKFFLFSVILLAFASCQEEVSFNNPSFEGKKDGVLWRSVDTRATINPNGSLTIDAYSNTEVVTLETISSAPQTYPLGTTATNLATYIITDSEGEHTYTSEDLTADDERGEIVIEEYDAINKTISGTFKFNVKCIDAGSEDLPTINFQYGKFYKIPVTRLTSTL